MLGKYGSLTGEMLGKYESLAGEKLEKYGSLTGEILGKYGSLTGEMLNRELQDIAVRQVSREGGQQGERKVCMYTEQYAC